MGDAIIWPLLFIEPDFSFFIEEPDFICSFFIDELFIECIELLVGFGDAPLISSAIAVPEATKNAAAMIKDAKRIRNVLQVSGSYMP